MRRWGGGPEPGQNNQKPLETTNAAKSTTTSTSILNGDVNPNGLATAAHFEWGQDPTLIGAATTTDQAIGNGKSSVAIAAPLTGLTTSTTYFYRVVATSTAGTSNGSIASFTTATPDAPPAVQTLGATGIATGGATLNGNANPNGLAAAAHFEWGQDPNLAGAATTTDQLIGNGKTSVAIAAPLTGLIATTTYYYRLVATNSAGTTNGTILSFRSSDNPIPNQGITFSKIFSSFGGEGVFSLDFFPTSEHESGGQISIRINDTPTTYFEFSTINASDPSKASFRKVRKGIVVDSAPFPFPYSQGGTYPIRISMSQLLATVDAIWRNSESYNEH